MSILTYLKNKFLKPKNHIRVLSQYNQSELMQLRDEFPIASDEYLDNGFRFSSEIMETIGGRIIKLPLEWQAEYITAKVKKEIDENNKEHIEFLKNWKSNSDMGYIFAYMDTTASEITGMIAYAAMALQDKRARQCAMDILNAYYERYNERVDKIRNLSISELLDLMEYCLNMMNMYASVPEVKNENDYKRFENQYFEIKKLVDAKNG